MKNVTVLLVAVLISLIVLVCGIFRDRVNEVIELIKTTCNLDIMSTNLFLSIYSSLTSTQRRDFNLSFNAGGPL